MRKYEWPRRFKRLDPEARYVIFLRRKGFSLGIRLQVYALSLGCRYGQLPLDGEGEIDRLFSWIMEKKKKDLEGAWILFDTITTVVNLIILLIVVQLGRIRP